jgi:hypothetical protein
MSIKKIFLILGAVIFATAGTIFIGMQKETAYAGASASLNITSSSSSYSMGDTITVWVNVNVTSGVVGSAEINLNYDKAKLKYKSIMYGEAFSNQFDELIAESSGLVSVVRGQDGGFSGSGKIFGVNFQAINTGSAAFSMSPVELGDSSGSIRPTVSGFSVSITAAPSDPPASSSSAQSSSAGQSSSKSSARSSLTSSKSTSSAKTSTSSSSQASVQTNIVPSPEKSEVTISKANIKPDGIDSSCLSIKPLGPNSEAISDKPEIKIDGELNQSELNQIDGVWQSCFTSKIAGPNKIQVYDQGILLKSLDLSVDSILVANGTSEEALSVVSGNAKSTTDKFFSKNEITVWDKIEISGQGQPGSTLNVYIHSTLIQKQVVVSSDGSWKIAIDKPMEAGSHRVEVAVVDASGKETEAKIIAHFDVKKRLPTDWTAGIITGGLVIAGLLTLLLLVIYRHRKNRQYAELMYKSSYSSDNTASESNVKPKEEMANQTTILPESEPLPDEKTVVIENKHEQEVSLQPEEDNLPKEVKKASESDSDQQNHSSMPDSSQSL